MKLSAIREQKAHDHKAASAVEIRQPRNGDEVFALFGQAMRALEARNDELALQLFDALSAAEEIAPPQLVATATAARDLLDPERTTEQKAEAMFHFFTPTLIRVLPRDEGHSQ
jgi:hypothetical protein